MRKLSNLSPQRVFDYFEAISAIPRGSGNMDKICRYCMDFAKEHSLRAVLDEGNNVIIFKEGTPGYENSEPIILQGHLDMVCQKEGGISIDFLKDGIDLYTDGDYIKAHGTTLGADNGIAVSIILAILESKDIPHPPIEAVFTTDEEIGMVGAKKLSFDGIKGRRMINIDAEDPKTLTVSCAGGSDFRLIIPVKRKRVQGEKVSVCIKGLLGGHSGVEINSGRVNSNILLGRLLNYAKSICDFDIINIGGGDKANAIPNTSSIELMVENSEKFISSMNEYIKKVKAEISFREQKAEMLVLKEGKAQAEVFDASSRDKLLFTLAICPNGVMEMSAEINGLVETSLNLGILKVEEDRVIMHFALRSNKQSAIEYLEDRLAYFADYIGCEHELFGHYPPWEFKENSKLQRIYIKTFKNKFGYEPKVVAIHAGLECGVFSSGIKDLDCIAIGPEALDVHTTNERLSISSTKEIYEIILEILRECK